MQYGGLRADNDAVIAGSYGAGVGDAAREGGYGNNAPALGVTADENAVKVCTDGGAGGIYDIAGERRDGNDTTVVGIAANDDSLASTDGGAGGIDDIARE